MDARGVGAVAKIHSAVCRARNKDAPVEAICRAPIAAKLQAEGFRDRSAHDAAELVGGVVAGGRLELALEVVAGLSRRNHERAGGRVAPIQSALRSLENFDLFEKIGRAHV